MRPFEGYHNNNVGQSFQVFGEGEQWFWWFKEPGPEHNPNGRSKGPFRVPYGAYEDAMTPGRPLIKHEMG